jgi:hypothetical protein
MWDTIVRGLKWASIAFLVLFCVNVVMVMVDAPGYLHPMRRLGLLAHSANEMAGRFGAWCADMTGRICNEVGRVLSNLIGRTWPAIVESFGFAWDAATVFFVSLWEFCKQYAWSLIQRLSDAAPTKYISGWGIFVGSSILTSTLGTWFFLRYTQGSSPALQLAHDFVAIFLGGRGSAADDDDDEEEHERTPAESVTLVPPAPITTAGVVHVDGTTRRSTRRGV